MRAVIIFKRDTKNVKRPLQLKSNIFLIYAPRNIEISPMQFMKDKTQTWLSLYPAVLKGILPRNLKRMKLSKFAAVNKGFGLEFFGRKNQDQKNYVLEFLY